MIVLKALAELHLMRQAGRIVARTLAELRHAAVPGVTTQELERLAHELITREGGVPSFKGYRGFPASICTSVNEELVHGIPGPRRLAEGDILSVDVGVIYRGWHGDAATTMPIGWISSEAQRLLEVTEGALHAAIAEATPGKRVGHISAAIQGHVERRGMAIVRQYVGHGIGRLMHEDPQVPNLGVPGRGPFLKPGMTLAIEPMVNLGDWNTRVLDDDWTVVTADARLCAHFEHTVAITDQGPEILTLLEEDQPVPFDLKADLKVDEGRFSR